MIAWLLKKIEHCRAEAANRRDRMDEKKPGVTEPGVEVTDAEYDLLMKFPRQNQDDWLVCWGPEEILANGFVMRRWCEKAKGVEAFPAYRLTMLGRTIRILVFKTHVR